MRSALGGLLVVLFCLAGCAHTTHRRHHPAAPVIAVAAGVVVVAGAMLLFGLIADCEQPGGNCRTADGSDPPPSLP